MKERRGWLGMYLDVISDELTFLRTSSTRSDSNSACLESKRRGICSSQTGHCLVSARLAG